MDYRSMATMLFFIVLAVAFLAGYFFAQLNSLQRRTNKQDEMMHMLIQSIMAGVSKAEKEHDIDLMQYFPFMEVKHDHR